MVTSFQIKHHTCITVTQMHDRNSLRKGKYFWLMVCYLVMVEYGRSIGWTLLPQQTRRQKVKPEAGPEQR